MTHYVLVGNGVASTAAIEAIRENDEEGDLSVVSKENHLAYSKPLISYLLGGEVEEEKMLYQDKEFYEENDVDLYLDIKTESVDPEQKTVSLDNGEAVDFDKLLVATGGSPMVPPVEGSDLNGVFTFTEWDDVRAMKEYMDEQNVENIVVVGGGLIGLKTTEALLELGKNVVVVELADRIMASTFDKKASDLLLPVLEKESCKVITEDTVVKILGEDGVQGAELKGGGSLDCGMVVFAIGVIPNTEILKGTDVDVDDGILVDKNMQTTDPDIYAAGDVVEIPDMIAGERRPIAIWPNSRRQGDIAGENMSGGSEEYEGSFAMNSVGVCDVPTISVGLTDPDEEGYEILEKTDEENTVYKKLVLENNTLVGTIFVNDIERAGIYTGLVKRGIDVSDFKNRLLDEDFGLIDLPKSYREELMAGEGMKL